MPPCVLNQIIYTEGDPAEYVYLVFEGTVEVISEIISE